MHAAVTLHIDAAPEDVWGLVSDITRVPGAEFEGDDLAIIKGQRCRVVRVNGLMIFLEPEGAH